MKSIRIENITFDQIRDNAFRVNLRKTNETLFTDKWIYQAETLVQFIILLYYSFKINKVNTKSNLDISIQKNAENVMACGLRCSYFCKY